MQRSDIGKENDDMKREESHENILEALSVGQTFIRYLIPSLVGMLLMAVNFVVDGIMVGNRLGPVALAGVGIAQPIYTVFLAMSIWIGLGAATIYSQSMGAKQEARARFIFTHSLVFIFGATVIIGMIAILFREPLAYALGANADTYPYVSRYMNILLVFGLVITVENALSIFVRNDGNPNLAMIALIVTAFSNIGLNYIALYILNLGVAGAAASTIVAALFGILVLFLHFFRKSNNLKLVPFRFDRALLVRTVLIGFPSFLAEVGISVFTLAHNITLKRLAGTDGVAAFSVLNYVHSVMLMMFLGMGAAIQPLISYYHGADSHERKQRTMTIAIWTAIAAGAFSFLVGQFASHPIVAIFGDFPEELMNLAVTGVRLFFIAYLFMGVNFVMMTYYQSVGNVWMATWITASREILIMLIFLFILPLLFGVNGVWLAIPMSELVVLITVYLYQKRHPF